MATEHQDFGLVPNINKSDSFFVLGGRMHGESIDCIFEVTSDEKRELIGHLSEPKSNFGVAYQHQVHEHHRVTNIYVGGGTN